MRFVNLPQIVGPTYTLDDTSIESQRCVNLYPEKVESTGEWWLKPTPGLMQFCDFGAYAPVMEGHTTSGGRAFFIAGTGFYEVFSNGSTLLHGTFSATPVNPRMVDNGLVLFIVWGTTAYTFMLASNTLAVLSDTGYLGGGFVAFLDQYIIVNQPNSMFFQLSPLTYDPTSVDPVYSDWDATDIYPAESRPDNITSLVVNGRELWLFGPDSYEVWYNAGDAIATFQRISGAAVDIGTSAPYSVTAIQGSTFWLGGSKQGQGIVWMSSGYQPQRISTHAIERMISDMTVSTDARAWSYLDGGHYFYCLNFPTAGVTLVYDISTGMWHERDFRVDSTNARTQHRAGCQIFAFGKNLVGDFESGKVYWLTGTAYSDAGEQIDRYRRFPDGLGNRETFYHKFELFAQVGTGVGWTISTTSNWPMIGYNIFEPWEPPYDALVNAQADQEGAAPMVSLRYSDDGAKTWSNYHTRCMGKMGEYGKEIVWNRLGSSKGRVWEIHFTDPVPFRVTGAELGVSVGVH